MIEAERLKKYFKARTVQAWSDGGMSDPFVTTKQLKKKFGDGWSEALKTLIDSGDVIDLEDGDYVLARKGKKE